VAAQPAAARQGGSARATSRCACVTRSVFSRFTARAHITTSTFEPAAAAATTVRNDAHSWRNDDDGRLDEDRAAASATSTARFAFSIRDSLSAATTTSSGVEYRGFSKPNRLAAHELKRAAAASALAAWAT
jgi:hypothetical protein